MVQSFGDKIFAEMKKINAKEMFAEKRTMEEKHRLLEELVGSLNITKSSLHDLDTMEPNTVLHLTYLIQKNFGVDMGICPFYKTWVSHGGEQNRCKFNEGPVQVHCYASRGKCTNPGQYDKHIGEING